MDSHRQDQPETISFGMGRYARIWGKAHQLHSLTLPVPTRHRTLSVIPRKNQAIAYEMTWVVCCHGAPARAVVTWQKAALLSLRWTLPESAALLVKVRAKESLEREREKNPKFVCTCVCVCGATEKAHTWTGGVNPSYSPISSHHETDGPTC